MRIKPPFRFTQGHTRHIRFWNYLYALRGTRYRFIERLWRNE